MLDLKDQLEILHALDDARRTATKWRDRGARALAAIEATTPQGHVIAQSNDNVEDAPFREWTCSGDHIELALLAKLRTRQESNTGVEGGSAVGDDLNRRLEQITLDELFPASRHDARGTAQPVPVLLAARALQALAARSETVVSKASLLCYYRIALELHHAVGPDWTIGAGRAGRGGRMSAFVTSECTRGILAFERALSRTSVYLRDTLALYEGFLRLAATLAAAGVDPKSSHPLAAWANAAIERMWLDWFISTHPRHGAVALYADGDDAQLLPLPPRMVQPPDVTLAALAAEFSTLAARITRVAERARAIHVQTLAEITVHPSRMVDGHTRASQFISRACQNALALESICRQHSMGQEPTESLRLLLTSLLQKYSLFSSEIHVVLEPAKRFVRSVLDRELAIAHAGRPFDAGEMVFAATALGTSTNWQDSEKTIEACGVLARTLPESGRLTTNCPFHATPNGYKLLPIGCEMTRHFAQLLHHTHYPVDAEMATRLLRIFLNDEQRFHNLHEDEDRALAGWNFENAPDANKPCVWVTAIAVMALARIIRMLSGRINEIVFQHFKVITPDSPHTKLTLNDLLYPDHGLVSTGDRRQPSDDERTPIGISLERMRAHVMGTRLPKRYREDGASGTADSTFSAILHGPPGTGKTTLLEALGLSSNAPLVMLSPSDLIVQGQEQLEARAKAVFDALSMLTRVVILFDEFEPVLRRRGLRPRRGGPLAGIEGEVHGVQDAIREGGASVLNFLLTGMLPKLGALHDAAERQAFVYCLATNHLEEIDPAARRRGRFDLLQPIYNPDPVSRAGALLLRLQSLACQMGRPDFLADPAARATFAAIVTATANISAGELSRVSFKVPSLVKGSDGRYRFAERDQQRSLFAHVLTGADSEALEALRTKIQKGKDDLKASAELLVEGRDHLEPVEAEQQAWLIAFELTLHQRLARIDEQLAGCSAACLEAFLLTDFDLSCVQQQASITVADAGNLQM